MDKNDNADYLPRLIGDASVLMFLDMKLSSLLSSSSGSYSKLNISLRNFFLSLTVAS